VTSEEDRQLQIYLTRYKVMNCTGTVILKKKRLGTPIDERGDENLDEKSVEGQARIILGFIIAQLLC
jgi:hypothetical protein